MTANYVALIHDYWLGIVAADNATANSNEASSDCLGTTTANSPRDATLVDPAKCRVRAVAILAMQQQFLDDLAMTVAPRQFASDDQIFHSQIPRAVAALNTLVAAAATGKKQATFDAASAYADIMLSSVTGALDDVDPSVHHY
jgi:hypothetical protein